MMLRSAQGAALRSFGTAAGTLARIEHLAFTSMCSHDYAQEIGQDHLGLPPQTCERLRHERAGQHHLD